MFAYLKFCLSRVLFAFLLGGTLLLTSCAPAPAAPVDDDDAAEVEQENDEGEETELEEDSAGSQQGDGAEDVEPENNGE